MKATATITPAVRDCNPPPEERWVVNRPRLPAPQHEVSRQAGRQPWASWRYPLGIRRRTQTRNKVLNRRNREAKSLKSKHSEKTEPMRIIKKLVLHLTVLRLTPSVIMSDGRSMNPQLPGARRSVRSVAEIQNSDEGVRQHSMKSSRPCRCVIGPPAQGVVGHKLGRPWSGGAFFSKPLAPVSRLTGGHRGEKDLARGIQAG